MIGVADFSRLAGAAFEDCAASVVDFSALGVCGGAIGRNACIGALSVFAIGGLFGACVAACAAIGDGIERGADIAAALFADGAQNAAARFDAIAVIVADFSRFAFARRLCVARTAGAVNAFGACVAAHAAIVRVGFQVGASAGAALLAGGAFGDACSRSAVFARAVVADLVVSALIPALSAIVCVVSDIGACAGAAERLRPAFGFAFFAGIRDDIARVAAV